MVLEKDVSSLTLKTDDVVVILKADENITLNCTYQRNSTVSEKISDYNIRWRILVNNKYKDLAIFSPPGGEKPFIEKKMEDIYKNRTDLIAPDVSQLSAVMIIKNPVCTDEGTYQCWIQYTIGTSIESLVESDTSSVQFNGTVEAKEPTEFLVRPREQEEKQSISLICNADVGRPHGNIQIWKQSQNLNTSELIYTSNSTTFDKENCMEYVNITLPVTRDDNGAIFRCSSQNNFTRDPGPSKEINTTVIYGPDVPSVTLIPYKTIYSIGDPLTINCTTVSNPPPVFVWSFLPYNKSEEMPIEQSNKNAMLVFDGIQTKNAGTYTCTVFNAARPHYPNMTTSVSVNVKNSESIKSVCDQCGYFKTCQQNSENTVCILNKWVPVTFVFILLSTAFAISSIVLITRGKKSKEIMSTNKNCIDKRSLSDATPEDIHGGYISPENLEFGSLPSSATHDNNSAAYSRL